MDLEKLAQLGEIIGALAVIVTLVYLARQIHQGTVAQNRETYRAFVAELHRAMFVPMTDPATMALLQKGARDFNSLNRLDQGIVNAVWSPIFLLFNEVYSNQIQGELDRKIAAHMDPIILGFLQMPGTADWFRHGKPFLSDEFVAHIDVLLANPNRSPATNEMLPWYFPDED